MNSNKNSPEKTPMREQKSTRETLNLPPKEAKREAEKLRTFRENLRERDLGTESATRSTPIRERMS